MKHMVRAADKLQANIGTGSLSYSLEMLGCPHPAAIKGVAAFNVYPQDEHESKAQRTHFALLVRVSFEKIQKRKVLILAWQGMFSHHGMRARMATLLSPH